MKRTILPLITIVTASLILTGCFFSDRRHAGPLQNISKVRISKVPNEKIAEISWDSGLRTGGALPETIEIVGKTELQDEFSVLKKISAVTEKATISIEENLGYEIYVRLSLKGSTVASSPIAFLFSKNPHENVMFDAGESRYLMPAEYFSDGVEISFSTFKDEENSLKSNLRITVTNASTDTASESDAIGKAWSTFPTVYRIYIDNPSLENQDGYATQYIPVDMSVDVYPFPLQTHSVMLPLLSPVFDPDGAGRYSVLVDFLWYLMDNPVLDVFPSFLKKCEITVRDSEPYVVGHFAELWQSELMADSPYRTLKIPEKSTNTKAIVFIHGNELNNPGSVTASPWKGGGRQILWNDFFRAVNGDQRFSEFDFFEVLYDTATKRLEEFGNEIAGKMSGTLKGYDSVYIVAHSMGGLVARAIVNSSSLTLPQNIIKGVVTLAAPLRGTPLASLMHAASSKTVPSCLESAVMVSVLLDLQKLSAANGILNPNLSKDKTNSQMIAEMEKMTDSLLGILGRAPLISAALFINGQESMTAILEPFSAFYSIEYENAEYLDALTALSKDVKYPQNRELSSLNSSENDKALEKMVLVTSYITDFPQTRTWDSIGLYLVQHFLKEVAARTFQNDTNALNDGMVTLWGQELNGVMESVDFSHLKLDHETIAHNGTVIDFVLSKILQIELSPEAPSDLTASPAEENAVILSWIDNSKNEDGFEIWRTDGSIFEKIGTVAADCTEYHDADIDSNTKYIYRVLAYNLHGSSEWTNIAGITALP